MRQRSNPCATALTCIASLMEFKSIPADLRLGFFHSIFLVNMRYSGIHVHLLEGNMWNTESSNFLSYAATEIAPFSRQVAPF